MDNHNIYGEQKPEAKEYFYIPAVGDWKGYKLFGWLNYPLQVITRLTTWSAFGFALGIIVTLIVVSLF